MQSSSLSVVFGPMGSSKTTRALEQVSQFCSLGFSVLYITSNIERERAAHGSVFYSHNPASQTVHERSTVLSCTDLPIEYPFASVVIIDEAQFYSNLEAGVRAALQQGCTVQVYGLASDFQGCKFGSITDLIPFADTVEQVKAKCIVCATQNHKIVPAAFTDKIGLDQQVVQAGTIGKYLPVCRQHHTKLD